MPDLDAFLPIASETRARTCYLSGDVIALLFSALADISQPWEWTKSGGLTQADIDYIDELISRGNFQVMTSQVGQIQTYITADPPEGTIPCDGGVYYRIDYPTLYDLIDPVYVLDADSFTTPFLNGRTLVGAGLASSGTTYAPNDSGGEETHTQVEDELAPHAHTDTGHTHSISTVTGGVAVTPGELPVNVPVPVILSFTGVSTANLTTTGSGTPFNVMQPYTVVKFCVVAL